MVIKIVVNIFDFKVQILKYYIDINVYNNFINVKGITIFVHYIIIKEISYR